MKLTDIDPDAIRKLYIFSIAEAGRLAKWVAEGRMSRDELEETAKAHPNDCEPSWALQLLDGGSLPGPPNG